MGHAKSMVALADMKGLKDDPVWAHFWLNHAAREGETGAAFKRDQLAKSMTPAQIAKAEKKAREWSPKRPPKCVLDESCMPMQIKP